MTEKQAEMIIEIAKKNYELLGCVFPCKDNREVVEYLADSGHPDEMRCLISAITAYNVFCNDNMDENDFFDWHGL